MAVPARFRVEAEIAAFCVTPAVVTKVIGELVAVKAAFTVTDDAAIVSGPPEVTAAPMVMAAVFPVEPIRRLLVLDALIAPVEYTLVNDEVV